MNEEYFDCAVCDDVGDIDKDNKLVTCAGCDVRVHQLCYGIYEEDIPGFVCSPCGKEVNERACVLCPVRMGAFKPTLDGKFVHVVCALTLRCCSFVDSNIMEPVKVTMINQNKSCVVCELFSVDSAKMGVKTKCGAKSCDVYLHATCAKQLSLLSEITNQNNQFE